MSIPIPAKATCPVCGQEFEYTMWQSVNTALPTAREDVISGRLFDVPCPHCGKTIRIVYPILYNDLENGMMVYLAPEESLDTVKTAVESIYSSGCRARAVTDLDHLREKAMILEAGLDDRVVEIMKLIVKHQIAPQGLGPVEKILFSDRESPRFEILAGGQWGIVALDMADYGKIRDAFSGLLEQEDAAYLIDEAWAQNILSSLE